MTKGDGRPYVVSSTPEGGIGERPDLAPLDYYGDPLTAHDLIPLPDGATLSMLPGRLAQGVDAIGEIQQVNESDGWALAALLPIGYTRTHLPAYTLAHAGEFLPLFGYTAVAGYRGRLYVAAIRTDNPERWLSRNFDPARLQRSVESLTARFPENRIIRQHAHCTLDYHCPTASNLFLVRWEGAIAVSGGCNARCVGCISKQEEDGIVSAQDRLPFVPTVEEIAEVAIHHLRTAPDAIISFGQGCEGEPLLQAGLIERAIKAIRAETDKGVLNINTNASHPHALERLFRAGLDMIRASTISARTETYNAYYRPVGYTFEHVKRSLQIAAEHGVFSSINLLSFPGLVDAEVEVEALIRFVRETHLRRIQIRNLNIDPEQLFARVSRPDGPYLGVKHMIDVLRRELPEVEIGNFSRPVQRVSRPA